MPKTAKKQLTVAHRERQTAPKLTSKRWGNFFGLGFFSSKFVKILPDVLLLAVLVFLISASLLLLNWSGLFLVVLMLINLAIYISYRYEVSLPGISRLSRRYVKLNAEKFSRLNAPYFHFRCYYYLVLLIHDIDSGLNLLVNNSKALEIIFGAEKRVTAKNLLIREAYWLEARQVHQNKKRQLTFASLFASIVLTVVILLATLLLAGTGRAATFGWIQTDWSGGADTAAIAVHPGNQNNWNKYYSKDSLISAGNGSVSLSIVTSTITDTSDADFATNTSSNTAITNGSISILKKLNATCSTSTECANNSCFNGSCFSCGSDTVAYDGGPFDANGITTSTGGYYRTVLIGGQCWLKDNLNAGTMIGSRLADNTTSQDQTNNGTVEKYCLGYLQQGNAGQITTGTNDCRVYGALYQYPEAIQYAGGLTNSTGTTIPGGDIKGICPTNWHIPADGDFTSLSTSLGGDAVAGGKLKATSTWTAPDTGTDNSSGFSALATGYRYTGNSFTTHGGSTYFWITQPVASTDAWERNIYFNDVNFYRLSKGRSSGFSVRCLKDATSVAVAVSTSSFATTTSRVRDFGAASISTAINWTASTTPGVTALVMQVRSGITAVPVSDSDPNWTAWTTVNSGDSLGSPLIGKRYFQYRAIFSSTDLTVPSLNDVTISWSSYVASASLVSSPYNSGSFGNVLPKISWTGTNTSTNNTIKLQIRSANSTSSLMTAAWCGYGDTSAPCAGTNYFDYTKNGRSITDVNHPLISGNDDQFFQYRITLTSAGTSTPTVSSVNVTYVVNAPPEFATTTTAVQQRTDGKVRIDYMALDLDTAPSGVGCPNCLISTLRYSIDNGASWNLIPSQYLSTPSGEHQGFGTTTAAQTSSTYALLWDAKSQIDGVYSTTTKIQITLNDLEGANNTVVTTTATFILDVKNPTIGAPAVIVKAHGSLLSDSAHPAQLTLNASDTSPLSMCITLDNSLTNCVPYNSTSSIAFVTDPDVAYVNFIDQYQNVTAASVQTPETPNHLIIRDVSEPSQPTYQEFLVWKAVAPPPQGIFQKYEIEYSTDGVNYSSLATIEDKSVNYYFHQNLVKNQKYYYRVYSQDSLGNTSYYTDLVNDIADGAGGSNPNPPVISNVEIVSTSTQGAVIEWDTDQLANSSVHYSYDDPATFSNTAGSLTMVDNSLNLGRHHVVLKGLMPGRSYVFTVESVNALGITGLGTNGGSGYSFQTISGPSITGVTANNLTNNSASIIWNTDVPSDSAVYFTTSTDYISFNTRGTGNIVTSHEILLNNLSKGTTYYYYVVSGVASDNNGGTYYSFSTPVDDVAPVLNAVTSTVVIDTKALINWTTSELADARVDYGTVSGNYNNFETDTNLGLNHSVLLSNLATSTTYYYIVSSNDASGNLVTSTEQSFTTLETLSQESAVLLRELQAQANGMTAGAANAVCSGGGGGGSSIDRTKPVISVVKAVTSDGSNATISWETDKSANSLLQYGTSTQYGFGQNSTDLVKIHSLSIKNLNWATDYHYRVYSIDENGNLGQTDDLIFNSGDGTGQPSATVDSTGASAAKDSAFSTALGKFSNYLSSMSGQVSVGALESALGSQYDLIRQLSEIVPAPLLGGEPRVTVTADTAIITWSTDKLSNSLVAIASAANYDAKKGDSGYSQVIGNPDEAVTNHIVVINDLLPETTYNYQVRSMSSIGSMSKSQNFVFNTKSLELAINNYTVERVSDQQATFRWLTSAETDATVKYSPYRNGVVAIDEQRVQKVKEFSTIHQVSLGDLESGIVYNVELSGKDLKGRVITKSITAFSTGNDNFPPTIYQVQTESAILPGKDSNIQTIISWLTNEPATGQLFYRKGVTDSAAGEWQKTPLENSYARKHVVVITKFEPGSIYQFKIEGTDSAGNLTTSKVYTILAPKQKDSVFQVIIKNFEDIFGWTKQLGL